MSASSVLYVYEGFLNPGDCFSYCGARHYINEIGVACEQGVTLRTTRDLPSQLDVSGPDLVAFVGAPWFWDGCVRSEKYAAAYALLKMASGAKKMAVGVGSCYLSSHALPILEAGIKAEKSAVREFWSLFDEIIVRDVLAWWILDLVGIKAALAPCPSVAVGEWYGRPQGRKGVAILSEPLDKNFIFPYMQQGDQDFYHARGRRLKEQGAADVEWIAKDRVTLAARSVKTICRSIENSGAAYFFTARMHAAMVSAGMGLHGDLLALDSRALSAKLYGINLVGGQADIFSELSDRAGASAPPAANTRDAVRKSLEAIL